MKLLLLAILFFITSFELTAEEAAPVAVAASSDTNSNSVKEVDVGYKKTDYQINGRYKAGAFLIYDCEGEYYACVDQDGSDKCRTKREEGIVKKQTRLPCAPLKKFDDKKSCLEKNYEVLEALATKRFCYPK